MFLVATTAGVKARAGIVEKNVPPDTLAKARLKPARPRPAQLARTSALTLSTTLAGVA